MNSCTIHPNKFFMGVDIVEPNMPAINDEKQEQLSEVHPLSFITSARIRLPVVKISFSYTTPRGNSKTSEHFTICQEYHDETHLEVEIRFLDHIEDFNRKKPFKKKENVKILSIDLYGFACFEIGK